MSVTVIQLWTCDLCDEQIAIPTICEAWTDETAIPPEGWTSSLEVPVEHRRSPLSDVCHACPECTCDPDWHSYQYRR